MVIKKVDPDQKIVQLNYSWSAGGRSSAGEASVKAEYIAPDKLKWYWKKSVSCEFQLKDGALWGTITGGQYHAKIKMTKIRE